MPKVQNIQKILLLDIDLVILTTENQLPHLSKEHSLSNEWISAKINYGAESKINQIMLINPIELAELIEYACTEHGGIMFLTSGFWTEFSIKKILQDHLDITSDTRKKIDEAIFLNPITNKKHFPYLSLAQIQYLPKNLRLMAFLNTRPDLRKGTHFIFVDDNEIHVNSFTGHSNVTPILATTNIMDIIRLRQINNEFNIKEFYLTARRAMSDNKQVMSTGYILQGLSVAASSNPAPANTVSNDAVSSTVAESPPENNPFSDDAITSETEHDWSDSYSDKGSDYEDELFKLIL